MKKYSVQLSEEIIYVQEVEAENEDEAREMAWENAQNGDLGEEYGGDVKVDYVTEVKGEENGKNN